MRSGLSHLLWESRLCASESALLQTDMNEALLGLADCPHRASPPGRALPLPVSLTERVNVSCSPAVPCFKPQTPQVAKPNR